VTFACLPPVADPDLDYREEPTITLLERRHLISGALTTGFRTWEAALHLGSYLLTPEGRSIINGKSVLELGAGTGLLAILAAKHINAKHVTTTDGDEGVVEALKENLFLNGLDDEKKVISSVLRWGMGLRGTWVEEDCDEFPYDVVIGADIVSSTHHCLKTQANSKQTYDKVAISSLVATLRVLFDMRPHLHVLISGAVRNPETFEAFDYACCKSTTSAG
jgi:predicted nicotinamide N-methyase